MPSVAGARKCRVQGCQRKPLFVDPGGDNTAIIMIAGEATHCAAHREEGFTLQQGFSLQDGFLLQHGEVVHNNYRGSGTYRNRTTSRSNNGGGGGSSSSSSSSDHTQTRELRGENQPVGGRGGGKGGKSRGSDDGGGRGSGSSSGGGSAGQRASRCMTCQFLGCPKTATHGSQKEATHCASHKQEGQIDHKHRLCENATPKRCLKQPSFGWPGESRKRFCGAHRKTGTVDLRNCEHEGCGTRASHGFGKGRARFCAAHSPPGTSIVANKPCEKEGCIVSPRFGVEGDKPRFCGSHKEKNMVNLKDRRCEQHPCKTQPTFALPGEKPRFCSKHKSEGHVNVRHKLCRHPQCKLVPTYGIVGTRVPVACLKHSDGEMVDLKRERMRMSKEKKRMPAAAGFSSGSGKPTAGRAGTAEAVVEMVGVRTGLGTTATTTAAAAAEKKRRRANQSLGGNPGIGRKIVDAIFASSQRVLDGEEAAATDESEWEEGSGEGQEEEDDEGEDDDDEEEEAGEKEKEKADMPGRSAHVLLPPLLLPAALYPPPPLPVAMSPLLPPTDPPIAKTGNQRRPFHESPLALLPGAIPRGGSAGHALELVASAAEHETSAITEEQEEGGKAAVKRARRDLTNERPSSVTVGRMLPGFPATGGENGGRSGGIPSGITNSRSTSTDNERNSSERRDSSAASIPRSFAGASENNPHTPRGAGPGPGLSLGVVRGGQQREGQQQRYAGEMGMYGNSGTSLSWSCVQCGTAVAPDDRHVLVCCGHGLLHKACTAVFVQNTCPCPKCFRLVSSSLQVFM